MSAARRNHAGPFLPEIIMRSLEGTKGYAVEAPQCQGIQTVAMFVDISKFTIMSENLARKGPAGIEALGFYLNRYMEHLIKYITRAGGDVFKFAGDAMVVLWPPQRVEPLASKAVPLPAKIKKLAHAPEGVFGQAFLETNRDKALREVLMFDEEAAAAAAAASGAAVLGDDDDDGEEEEEAEDGDGGRAGRKEERHKDHDDDDEAIDREMELGPELVETLRRACQCALSIGADLTAATFTDEVQFSVKIGIGVGDATILHVGGVFGRMEYLACGPALLQAFRSEAHASPGQAIVSQSAFAHVEGKFAGERVGSSNFVRLTETLASMKMRSVRRTMSNMSASMRVVGKRAAAAAEKDARTNATAGGEEKKKSNARPSTTTTAAQLEPGFEERMKQYIPAAVATFVDQADKFWTTEIRQISIVFVNLGFRGDALSGIAKDPVVLHRLQTAVACVQAAVYLYEGSLNKFLVDDKGSTLVAVFGLPRVVHEDDPSRAIVCALTMHERLRMQGLRCALGVTTGTALCGLVGSSSRREYSVLGDVVNLAARFMQAAGRDGRNMVLCDDATARSVSQTGMADLRFEMLPKMRVKGKSKPVAVFRPVLDPERYYSPVKSMSTHLLDLLKHPEEQPARLLEKYEFYLPGRSELVSRVLAVVSMMVDQVGGKKFVLIQGEGGVGRTAFLQFLFCTLANQRDMAPPAQREKMPTTLWGHASFLTSGFTTWRRVFQQLSRGRTPDWARPYLSREVRANIKKRSSGGDGSGSGGGGRGSSGSGTKLLTLSVDDEDANGDGNKATRTLLKEEWEKRKLAALPTPKQHLTSETQTRLSETVREGHNISPMNQSGYSAADTSKDVIALLDERTVSRRPLHVLNFYLGTNFSPPKDDVASSAQAQVDAAQDRAFGFKSEHLPTGFSSESLASISTMEGGRNSLSLGERRGRPAPVIVPPQPSMAIHLNEPDTPGLGRQLSPPPTSLSPSPDNGNDGGVFFGRDDSDDISASPPNNIGNNAGAVGTGTGPSTGGGGSASSTANSIQKFRQEQRRRAKNHRKHHSMPGSVSENSLTSNMEVSARRAVEEQQPEAFALMFEMLKRAAPVVVMLDDCEHMSRTDWKFTQYLLEKLSKWRSCGIVILMGCTPLASDMYKPRFSSCPAEYTAIASSSTTHTIELPPMDQEGVSQLLRCLWKSDSVAANVVDNCLTTTGGYPSCVTKYAKEMRTAGHVQTLPVNGGLERETVFSYANYVEHNVFATILRVPFSVSRSVTSKLDRLPAAVQITLKVAAVLSIGAKGLHEPKDGSFWGGYVQRIHPYTVTVDDCAEHMRLLTEHLFLKREVPEVPRMQRLLSGFDDSPRFGVSSDRGSSVDTAADDEKKSSPPQRQGGRWQQRRRGRGGGKGEDEKDDRDGNEEEEEEEEEEDKDEHDHERETTDPSESLRKLFVSHMPRLADAKQDWENHAYTFVSDYLRDVVYSVMLFEQRARLHRKVVRVMEASIRAGADSVNASRFVQLQRHKELCIMHGKEQDSLTTTLPMNEATPALNVSVEHLARELVLMPDGEATEKRPVIKPWPTDLPLALTLDGEMTPPAASAKGLLLSFSAGAAGSGAQASTPLGTVGSVVPGAVASMRVEPSRGKRSSGERGRGINHQSRPVLLGRAISADVASPPAKAATVSLAKPTAGLILSLKVEKGEEGLHEEGKEPEEKEEGNEREHQNTKKNEPKQRALTPQPSSRPRLHRFKTFDATGAHEQPWTTGESPLQKGMKTSGGVGMGVLSEKDGRRGDGSDDSPPRSRGGGHGGRGGGSASSLPRGRSPLAGANAIVRRIDMDLDQNRPPRVTHAAQAGDDDGDASNLTFEEALAATAPRRSGSDKQLFLAMEQRGDDDGQTPTPSPKQRQTHLSTQFFIGLARSDSVSEYGASSFGEQSITPRSVLSDGDERAASPRSPHVREGRLAASSARNAKVVLPSASATLHARGNSAATGAGARAGASGPRHHQMGSVSAFFYSPLPGSANALTSSMTSNRSSIFGGMSGGGHTQHLSLDMSRLVGGANGGGGGVGVGGGPPRGGSLVAGPQAASPLSVSSSIPSSTPEDGATEALDELPMRVREEQTEDGKIKVFDAGSALDNARAAEAERRRRELAELNRTWVGSPARRNKTKKKKKNSGSSAGGGGGGAGGGKKKKGFFAWLRGLFGCGVSETEEEKKFSIQVQHVRGLHTNSATASPTGGAGGADIRAHSLATARMPLKHLKGAAKRRNMANDENLTASVVRFIRFNQMYTRGPSAHHLSRTDLTAGEISVIIKAVVVLNTPNIVLEASGADSDVSLALVRSSSLTPTQRRLRNLAIVLLRFESWNFDVFALEELLPGRVLSAAGLFAFSRYDITERFEISFTHLLAFLRRLDHLHSRQRDHPFFNATHSANVLHACCFFIDVLGLRSHVTDLDILAMLLASMLWRLPAVADSSPPSSPGQKRRGRGRGRGRGRRRQEGGVFSFAPQHTGMAAPATRTHGGVEDADGDDDDDDDEEGVAAGEWRSRQTAGADDDDKDAGQMENDGGEAGDTEDAGIVSFDVMSCIARAHRFLAQYGRGLVHSLSEVERSRLDSMFERLVRVAHAEGDDLERFLSRFETTVLVTNLAKMDRDCLLEMIFRSAVDGYGTKRFELYSLWIGRYMEEEFRAGEKRKKVGLPVLPFQNRLRPRVAAFAERRIKHAHRPLFETFARFSTTIQSFCATRLQLHDKMWRLNPDAAQWNGGVAARCQRILETHIAQKNNNKKKKNK